LRQDAHKGRALENLERAVHIVYRASQQQSDESVVAPREEAPQRRVLPVDPVAARDCVTARERQHVFQFIEMELAIRVRKGNEVIWGRLDPGSQRGAIPEVFGVLDQPHVRVEFGLPGDYLRRVIVAAIIDNDNLVLVGRARERGFRFLNGLANRRLFIPSWDDQRKLVADLPILPWFRGPVEIAGSYMHPCHSFVPGNGLRWEDRPDWLMAQSPAGVNWRC